MRGTEINTVAEKYRLWEALLSLNMTYYSKDVNSTEQRTHIRSCTTGKHQLTQKGK